MGKPPCLLPSTKPHACFDCLVFVVCCGCFRNLLCSCCLLLRTVELVLSFGFGLSSLQCCTFRSSSVDATFSCVCLSSVEMPRLVFRGFGGACGSDWNSSFFLATELLVCIIALSAGF